MKRVFARLVLPEGMSDSSVLAELEMHVNALEADVALYDEINFVSRANALDFIEVHIIGRIEGLLQNSGADTGLNKLSQRAESVCLKLEKIDTGLFSRLRGLLKTGKYTKSAFKELIYAYTGYRISDKGVPDKVGYDHLDDFVNGLLAEQAVPEATLVREPEMVFYQKTPARIIFELIERAQFMPDDVFVDLGSGLGQVPVLVNLVSGTAAKGMEYEPAYCHYANACATALNLDGVEFFHTDVRNGDFSEGTVFYLYTPFEGKLLQDVLRMLHKESQKRAIRIFTYGPCSKQVACQTWLASINGPGDDFYKLYAFRPA